MGGQVKLTWTVSGHGFSSVATVRELRVSGHSENKAKPPDAIGPAKPLHLTDHNLSLHIPKISVIHQNKVEKMPLST